MNARDDNILDYTSQGRRPSVCQVMADWRKRGRPNSFAVIYGETFAEFERCTNGEWWASGNGQPGVKREAIERALRAEAVLVPI